MKKQGLEHFSLRKQLVQPMNLGSYSTSILNGRERANPNSVTELEPVQQNADIKAAETKVLLQLHKDKPLHGVFFKNIEDLGLSKNLTHFSGQDDIFAEDKDDAIKNPYNNDILSDLTDSEENSNSPKRSFKPKVQILDDKDDDSTDDIKPVSQEKMAKLPSAGPSGRPTAVPRQKSRNEMKILHISSESEDSENEDRSRFAIPGEYDPKLYDNLEVDEDAKDIFQFILKYIPQQLNLDYKFKPFIPEFLPAVGDIDAFLKVVPPEKAITGDDFDDKFYHLGLTVLDEPATNQSDPALLYLQLRAASVNPSKRNDGNVVVKKVDNIEKNSKVIDKWIKDISDLHKSKSSPIVRYSEPMPDLDDLMQEWPEEMERKLKETGFPEPKDMSLSEYVDTVCSIFQIPIAKKKMQSLHLLFCLYAAIKQTQLYKSSSVTKKTHNVHPSSKKEADQLVLD